MTNPLRIGMLGAAPIAVAALIRPARRLPNVEVVAVAARDPARARRYAARQGIPGIHRSYAALLEDSTIVAAHGFQLLTMTASYGWNGSAAG